MKGCNTLTLCPAQMHEAVEFWLKNQFLLPAQASTVKVETVHEKGRTAGCSDGFEIELRQAPPAGETAEERQAYGDALDSGRA